MVDSDRKFLFSVIYLIALLFTMYFSYTFISSYIQQKREYELFKQSWQYVADTNFETEVEIDPETNEERVVNLISTPEQLAGAFLHSSSVWAEDDIGSITNSTYKLTCNVDLSGKAWTSYNFSGTFDGGSFVVSNLTTNSGFVATLSGKIRSLIFANVKINCTSGGTVASTMTAGNIERVSVVSGNVSGSSTIGGIVGSMSGGEIKGCKNSASVQSGVRMGGIVGMSNGGTISNCINYGSVSKSECSTSCYLGGIVGYMSSGTIQKCMNRGGVTGSKPGYLSDYSKTTIRVGGIVGYLTGTVSECANYEYVSGEILLPCEGTSCAGGVAGETSDATIQNCYNKGTITSQVAKASSSSNVENVLFRNGKNDEVLFWYAIPQAGDWLYYKIVGGQTKGKDGMFKDAKESTNTIEMYEAYTGGMVGYVNNNTNTTVSGCLNMGEVRRNGKIKRRYNLNYKIRWSSKNDMYNDEFLINQNFSYTESGLFGPITGWGGKISNCYDYYNAGANFETEQYGDLVLTQKVKMGGIYSDDVKTLSQMNGVCPNSTEFYYWGKSWGKWRKYSLTYKFGCKVARGGNNTLYFYIKTQEYAFAQNCTVDIYDLKEYDSYPISNSWTPNTTNVTKGYPSDSSIWNDNHELKNLFW